MYTPYESVDYHPERTHSSKTLSGRPPLLGRGDCPSCGPFHGPSLGWAQTWASVDRCCWKWWLLCCRWPLEQAQIQNPWTLQQEDARKSKKTWDLFRFQKTWEKVSAKALTTATTELPELLDIEGENNSITRKLSPSLSLDLKVYVYWNNQYDQGYNCTTSKTNRAGLIVCLSIQHVP